MIEVKRASDMGESCRYRISEIFIDAFGEYFTYFSKDKQKLAGAFAHMFILEVMFTAVLDGEIAGMAICTDSEVRSIHLRSKELIKHLGIIKGTIASIVLKEEFQKPPIEMGAKKASVEFVATHSTFRGNGVATAIMHYIHNLPQYDEYILEVADTNTNAVSLYTKLGYQEFKRIKHKQSKTSGINYLVYMKYKTS